MPAAMHKLGFVFVFQWYAMFIYWQFVSLSVGESVFGVTPDQKEAFQQAAGWSGLMAASYNAVTMIVALIMLPIVVKLGGRIVHAASLKATNAMLLAGALFLVAAVAMLWVKAPSQTDDSEIVPLGGSGDHASQVYDRVVVGSDGSYSSLVGVRQAMAIARRNGAKRTIVTVYNPEGASKGPRRELEGVQAGRHALQRTVDDLNSNRVTTYVSVLHPGDVAGGLLVAAADTPKTLIVVGNRGVGARDGGNLGVVADQVLKSATCDVIVVCTDETAGV